MIAAAAPTTVTTSVWSCLVRKGWRISRRKPRREVTFYKGEKVISDGLHPGWLERMEPTFYQALDAFIKAMQGEETEYPTLWTV